ncbi:MAG: Gfo/Idh/MocA family oxidoreductase [Planctomycetota bacterium]
MSKRSNKIRVGIIRCDTHGYWYAPIFEAPDPDIYRANHRGCHYYYYEWQDPRKLRKEVVPGFEIAAVWDGEDRTKAEKLSECYRDRPLVCDSFEEVSDHCDLVYVADCNYEGKDHLRLATPGITKGVPTFVDKPFAFTLADAKAIIHLADEHNVPIMCSSLMRQSPYLETFKNRFPDIAPVGVVIVPCGGPGLNAVFHGLSTTQAIMGEGCRWVQSMGTKLFDVLRMRYANSDAVMFNAMGRQQPTPTYAWSYSHCGYTAAAYGKGGAIHTPRIDDYLFLDGGVRIVQMAKRMVRTRKPPIPYSSILELMRIIEAARIAHNKGVTVALEDAC